MKKIVLLVLSGLILLGIVAAYFGYSALFSGNVKAKEEKTIIQIPTDSNFEEVKKIFEQKDLLHSISNFDLTAKVMKYTDRIKPGQFTISNNMTNKTLVSLLRSGKQTPVKLVINNVRDYKQLAGKIAAQLEGDSLQFKEYFESIINKEEIESQAFLNKVIPNTYEFYWNTSPEKFITKMVKERTTFWDKKNRKQKATELDMTLDEVYSLASIVEKETNLNSEKALVAGVYLNRLKKGILLQADPTVVFANNDFTIKRVLNRHLEKDSPYNTYKYAGLPPGPIYMPSISSIDAVLNPDQKANYLYFCAKPGYDGGHLFAKNLIDHNKNARIYHRWLSSEGIR